MASNPMRKLVNRIGVAIDWRVRDVLEAERQATVELGQTFIRATAQLTDQQRLLEVRVAELEQKLNELKNR